MNRVGDWMQTYTGGAYWPLDPRPEEVHIEDIAHALSMICRYGGHVRDFYSVAEHSYHVSHMVPPEHALQGLLHDATEAYLGDVIRPLKHHLGDYGAYERSTRIIIADSFGLDWHPPVEVKAADNLACVWESRQLMRPSPFPEDDWRVKIILPDSLTGRRVYCWPPALAKEAFLMRFRELV